MSVRMFAKGLEKLADDGDWDTNTIKVMQIDLGTTDTMVKAITSSTNATPIVVTCTAHGFANGDIVYIRGITTGTSGNGTWQVANQATNTFELKTVKDNLNSVGNGVGSGGVVINLGASCTNLGQIDGGRIGTDQTLGSKTQALGALDAADPTFTGVTGNVDAIVAYIDTGSPATSTPLIWIDGKMQIVVSADAASSATTLWVEPLAGAVANAVSFVTSAGVTVTLSAGASAGARSLSVNALSGAIAAGHTADVPTTGAGLPFTGGGGSYTYQFDNGPNKIIKI